MGTKATSSARRTVRSTSRQYTKVATKVPSTTWFAVSRMKLRSSRGPNWDEASDSTTSVIEKTVPAMAIIEPGHGAQQQARAIGTAGVAPAQALQPVVRHGLVEFDGGHCERHGQARHDGRHEPETGSKPIPILQQQCFQLTSLLFVGEVVACSDHDHRARLVACQKVAMAELARRAATAPLSRSPAGCGGRQAGCRAIRAGPGTPGAIAFRIHSSNRANAPPRRCRQALLVPGLPAPATGP